MLSVTAEPDLDALADHLAGVLARPVADPLAPEWVVVVSAGMQRWLSLALARRLGTSDDGRGDGVAANLDLLFPGRLTRRLLRPDEDDPWELDRLVWAVLDVLDAHADDPRLGPAVRLDPGVTRWGRARRLADLLDRYLLHRPGMVRAWAAGHDRDELGRALPADARWQAVLFRRVHGRIGTPSPPELLPERLADLRAGQVPADVPERVSLFGLSTIPGGSPFLDVLDALGATRDVHLLVHQPSPGMAEAVRAAGGEVGAASQLVDGHPVLARRDDPTTRVAHHPLVRSWARPAREAAVLLGSRLPEGAATGPDAAAPHSLLGRLQADLQADRAPAGDLVPDPGDRSVVIHACHGPTRQVEVLRDQLLHLLADDPTLSEDDIVVLCPALDEFAPLLEAVLGPPASADDQPRSHDPGGPPALAYRIADRSLGASYPMLRSLGALVELLASRASDAAVLDLVDLPPVRQRFGFDDADLDDLADWVEDADVRWGLDGTHRQAWGVPATHRAGTWEAALDRLLLGLALTDDADALAVGEVVPVAVDGGRASLAGRFADLLARLRRLVAATAAPRPVADWVELLATAADELFAPPPTALWERTRLQRLLEDLGRAAELPYGPCRTDLDLDDVRALLGRHLEAPTGRASFFRGGITVSSLTPLRGLRHRVVCLLGMDESAFGAGAPDGDDLTAAEPLVGDRDRRADRRQTLLETVAAAGEQLVVLRTGHHVVTNQEVPPAVVVAELRDAVAATVAPSVVAEVLDRLEVVHPRQAFDERNFLADGGPDAPRPVGPWGFDPAACAGARSRRRPRRGAPTLLRAPLPSDPPTVVDLADLHRALAHPVRHLLQQVLEVHVRRRPRGTRPPVAAVGGRGLPRAAEGRDLVLDLDGLESWRLRDAHLAHCLHGGDPDAFLRRLRAAGAVPPGVRGEAELAELAAATAPLLGRARELGVAPHGGGRVPIDVRLDDGTRVVGSVADSGGDRPGPVRASASGHKAADDLAPWLDVLALTVQDPATPWAGTLLNPAKTKKGYQERTVAIPLDDADARRDRARDALALVVALHRRASIEPLPLFPKLSPALHRRSGESKAWVTNDYGTGDDADPWIRLAFGRLGLAEITSLPVLDGDPPGTADDRARRWADHLWGAVAASQTDDEGGAA